MSSQSKSPSVGNWDIFPLGEQCRTLTLMWSPLSGSRQQDLLTNSHQLLLECSCRRFWWPERDLSREWGGGRVLEVGIWAGIPENGVCHRDTGWLHLLHTMSSLCLTTTMGRQIELKRCVPRSLEVWELWMLSILNLEVTGKFWIQDPGTSIRSPLHVLLHKWDQAQSRILLCSWCQRSSGCFLTCPQISHINQFDV